MSEKENITKDNITDELNKTVNELRARISELRKKGADMKIASLKILEVPPKISMFKITKDSKDLERIKTSIEYVEKEINESNNKLGLDNIDKIHILINDANIYLDNNRKTDAENTYEKIEKIYSGLSGESKLKLKYELDNLNKKIATSENQSQIQKINKK